MSYKMPYSLFQLPDRQQSRLSIYYLLKVYRELLEPSLINRVLILNYPFNSYKPRPSTILSLIQSLLFLLISIIILIIDTYNNLLTRYPTYYNYIRNPYKPK